MPLDESVPAAPAPSGCGQFSLLSGAELASIYPNRLGIDGLNTQALESIHQLGTLASGVNGLSWHTIQPDPPSGNDPGYSWPAQIDVVQTEIANIGGRDLQLNIRAQSDWALVRDPNNKVTNPTTGTQEGGILRIHPDHHDDWQAFIRALVARLQPVMLQIGSEAENEWVDVNGYLEALKLAAEAAREEDPNIIIAAPGWNSGDYFALSEADQATADASGFDKKLDFMRDVIAHGCADVISWHANRGPETTRLTQAWIESVASDAGVVREYWADDSSSGPWLTGVQATPEGQTLLDEMESGDQAAIETYWSLQAAELVKKVAVGLGSGLQVMFISTDVDWPTYYLPMWRYQGLHTSGPGFEKKPAYYAAGQLIQAVNSTTLSGERVTDSQWRFTSGSSTAVLIAWSSTGNPETVDLSAYFSAANVEVERVITEVGVTSPTLSVSSASSVDLTSVPVIIRPSP